MRDRDSRSECAEEVVRADRDESEHREKRNDGPLLLGARLKTPPGFGAKIGTPCHNSFVTGSRTA
jgi:hypothetical protein